MAYDLNTVKMSSPKLIYNSIILIEGNRINLKIRVFRVFENYIEDKFSMKS